MAATVTNKLKFQLLNTLYDEVVNSTNRYYVAIGRSEAWDSAETVPAPLNSLREIRNFKLSAQSIKQVTDVSFVIPRYNWLSGTVYSSWDDNLAAIPSNSYYVITEDNQVYICLKQGKTALGAAVQSTEKPSGTSTNPVKMADGYIWKFMYSISGAISAKFLSANFMPVAKIYDSSGTPGIIVGEREQAIVQEAATGGQVLGISITDQGNGYTSAPTVTIVGNGKNASASATVSAGKVINIELDSSVDSAMTMGFGYDFASITMTGGGGSGAAARAILSNDSGIGGNAISDLRSSSLMFNVKPSGIENGDFIVANQDFRQVALMKRPRRYADSDYTNSTGRLLRYISLTSVADTEAFVRDVVITGATSGAKAIIDDIDSDRLYAHQTEITGFLPFNEGETITGGGQTGTLVASGVDADSDAFSNDDVERFKNDIIYIENRAPVERTLTQTEDIKAVITL
jgi:hypothetical protein